MKSFSSEDTVTKALNHFKTNSFVSLVAQMQSGKTGTYLALAKAILKSALVAKVVIFSGNSETLLRDQTQERVDQDDYLNDKTKVVWGSELLKYIPDLDTPTLYVWDESHCAQSDDSRVDKFCLKCGICPAGGPSLPGVKCLSVSATPFSEVIDATEDDTQKLVIFQKTPAAYYGIKQMLETNRIDSYADYAVKMDSLVKRLSRSAVPKVGVIRLREDGKGVNKLAVLRQICEKYQISFELYDAHSDDDSLMAAIETQPTESNIVVVKSKLCMGKTIKDKRHVMWCLETAKTSNADTTLQGLLGRFCGYDNPSKGEYLNKKTRFFVSQKNIGGLTDYVKYFRTCGENGTPKRAMNVVKSHRDKVTYAPVIKLPLIDKAKVKSIIDALHIPGLTQIPVKGYRFFAPGKMVLSEGAVPKIEPGHGAKYREELNIYNIGEWSYLVYAEGFVAAGSITTTKKEVFSKRLKTLYRNGFVIGGPRPESFVHVREMVIDIRKLIQMWKVSDGLMESKIQNNGAVRISLKVYESLKYKGFVYRRMEQLEHVRIKLGRVVSQDVEYVVVEDISW